MRKIIFQNLITLDGYYEGPNREIDWHNVDAEFNEYAVDFLNRLETLIFGRVTYQLMASYWPTGQAINDDSVVAERMNNLPKIVFSKTLEKAEWHNTRLVKNFNAGEINKLKEMPGKDMAIFGSSDLALSFIQFGLIDEFVIFLNPLFLGGGKPLLKGINERFKLKLINVKQMKSGNVILNYEPLK